MKEIILASASPRRRALLKRLGFRFRVIPSGIDEKIIKTILPVYPVRELRSKTTKTVSSIKPLLTLYNALPPTSSKVFSNGARLARRLAYEKAKTVADKIKEGIVIGADTIVVVKGKIIGKPTSYQDAKRILRLLSGTTHKVITGLAIIDAKTNEKLIGHETTTVRIRKIEKEEIECFARLHPDKAGSYAAQEDNDALIENVKGDFSNVVGLPVNRLKKMLRKFNVVTRNE